MVTRTEVLLDEKSAAEPKLVFRSGPARGKVLVIQGDRLTLGRDESNDVVIRDSRVSSFHAVLVRDGAGFSLEDTGSKNGTFVNGERVERVALNEEDVFCLCRTGAEVQFTYGAPKLPSLLETTGSTFARTHSLDSVVRELLPNSRGRVVIGARGVRELLDHTLEDCSRRTRITVALSAAAAFAVGVALVAVLLYPASRSTVSTASPEEASRAESADPSSGGLPLPPAAGVRAELELGLEPIYGSLFFWYRKGSIGWIRVANTGSEVLDGAELMFGFRGEASDFLVEPVEWDIPAIRPGEERTLEVFPKLSNKVLSQRTREVTAEARLLLDGVEVLSSRRAIFVHGYHEFSWEIPKRVAVFVDPEDEAVQAFVKAVWPLRPRLARREFPPRNVVGAATLLTGLIDRPLGYRPDARTPISVSSTWKAQDRVSYPGETLLDGSGDCDDLSVLCCAVLEAAGIPTAIVVGADHVFFLVDSGLEEEDLQTAPVSPETVVCWSGRVWIPIESTELAGREATFARAWAAAWRFRQPILAGDMVVVDMQEAWRDYQPLNPPAGVALRTRIQQAGWVRAGLKERVDAALDDLEKSFLDNLSGKVEEISEGLEGAEREQAIALAYAQSGLYREAARRLAAAVFGEEPPSSAVEVAAWGGRLDLDGAILLYDLGIATFLGARTPPERQYAAACLELALSALPPGIPEAAEVMLRLAVIRRLEGDREGEARWKARAIELRPTLERRYESLLAGSGSVAGEGEALREYLEHAFRALRLGGAD